MYTLGDIPRKSALFHGDRTAVVFEDVRLTHRELNSRVNRLAGALAAWGIEKGVRIAILGENSDRYLTAYFAAAKLGACVVPLNFRLSDNELKHILEDSEAGLLFAGEGYEQRAATIAKQVPSLGPVIALEKAASGMVFLEDLIRDRPDREPDAYVHEDDLAVLMYTGGTTGQPKGVMLSHRNLMTAVTAMAVIAGVRPTDSTCFVLPLFHVSIWPVFLLLLAGGKVVINRKMDLGEILRLIQDEQCTHMNLVPTVYTWLMEYPQADQYDLSSLQMLSYAGSPFPPENLSRCIRRFGPLFAQGYGSTETAGGPVSFLSMEDHHVSGPNSRLLASAGKPSVCSEVRILDEDGTPLPAGQIGEVAVKGRHVMMGYWKNPELTEKTLRDGWLHMGDMGLLDHDGYLFLLDRKADMIVTGGENVYPQETENVLYQHEAVLECAVVSAPDDRWGERVQAVVVLKNEAKASEEELIAHCKAKLAGYKCPKSIVFQETLPKTPIGKILRKELKQEFWKGHNRSIG
ncbi:MAG: long-chain-fatty-acid--CoA ligase [Deltaproteobacteria bacterium]|nr:long-chain-fatty-acid--CoA ligase [Deltaproteobacteria bacterium]